MPAFDAVTVTLVETVVGKNKCAARSYSLIISFEKFSTSFIFVVLLLAFEKLSSSWSSNVISCCWSFCIWEVVRRVHRPQLTNCLATRGGELSLKVYLELDSDLITITTLVTIIIWMMIMTKLIVNSMTILIISSPMLILNVFLKPARNLSKFCLRLRPTLPTPSIWSSWW